MQAVAPTACAEAARRYGWDMRPLILVADDYALSPAVSRGILEALAAGRLSGTGVMTNRPFWREGAAVLAPFLDRAEIGLHLNLTLGAPLDAMPGFAPEGLFPALGGLLPSALAGRLPERELRAEIDRQLDAFVDATGRPPAYVDGHQHVHVLPGVRDWLLDALAARGWAGRVWLRDCADRPGAVLRRRSEIAKATFVGGLARGFAAAARARGFATNDGFAGFSSFDPARDYGADFRAFLVVPGRRHLVMCHPGHTDAELAAVDPHTQSRENELAFLLSPDFPAALNGAGLALARFSGDAVTMLTAP